MKKVNWHSEWFLFENTPITASNSIDFYDMQFSYLYLHFAFILLDYDCLLR